MKTSPVIISVIYCSAVIALADTETNFAYIEVTQATNVQSVISALPDIEKLWPQEPEIYLKAVNQAAHILVSSKNDPDTEQALENMFDSMMQKSCPTNEEQAVTWIKLKQDVVLYYLGFNDIQNNGANWLELAKFIGEVRFKIISNYTNQGTMISVLAVTPAEKLKLQKEIEENERNEITDEFQAELRQANNILTYQLLYNCHARFPSSNSTNTTFFKQISDAAHLTNEERKKL